MQRHVVHELRLGSFADGQAAELPDTALVGRFCTGQEHPDGEADQACSEPVDPAPPPLPGGAGAALARSGAGRAVDGGHTPAVIRRNDPPAPAA